MSLVDEDDEMQRLRFFAATLALMMILAAQPMAARASVLAATAENVQAQLALAQDGDTLKLNGAFPSKIAIYNLKHAAPVTVDLTQAQVALMAVFKSSNWTFIGDGHGGGEVGNGAPFGAMDVRDSDHIVFSGLTFDHYVTVGIGILDSHDVSVTNNVFRDATGDGVDVVSSQDISITGNLCERLPYGVVVHTDCVQIWNKPKDPLTVVNVLVNRNHANGHMQGFTTFGAGDPRPLVGVVITDNLAEIDTKWAGEINFREPCLKCTMRGNHSKTLPSYPQGWEPIGWYDGQTQAPGNVAER